MNGNVARVDAIRDELGHGFNCAQVVLMHFCPEVGLDTDTGLRLASGFGGGMRMGGTCGAVTGGLMVLGLLQGFGAENPSAEREHIRSLTQDFIDRFTHIHGNTECKELLGIDTSQPGNREIATSKGLFHDICPNCILSAIDILQELSSQ